MKALLLVVCMLASASLFAEATSSGSGSSYSDSSDSGLNVSSEIKAIKALLAKEQYKRASRKAQQVINQDWYNADAWNLMGFSQRKMGDYKRSRKSYARALKFNPEHKGALEYQGELYIKLGQIDKARTNQEKLIELCPNGCKQLDQLTKALAAATG